MTSGSLFDRDLSEWTWDELDGFLNQRIRENERIEYKAVYNDSFEDTLISMANGDGGFIFVGVEENNDKRPSSWPVLPADKDMAQSAFSRVASSTTPKVPIDARGIPKPDGSGQVVVVRVMRGLNPPYFSPGRGVRVRVGDGDVHADPRMLELLFARRTALTDARREFRQQIVAGSVQHAEVVPTFYFLVRPLGRPSEAQFGEESSRQLRMIVNRTLTSTGFTSREVRTDGAVEFVGGSPDLVRVSETGQVRSRLGLPHVGQTGSIEPLNLTAFIRHCYYFLGFADSVHARVFGTRGDLYIGVAAEHLEGRPFTWPEQGRQPERAITAAPMDTWIWDGAHHTVGQDPVLAARAITKALAWRAGYVDYEDVIDSWGRNSPWVKI